MNRKIIAKTANKLEYIINSQIIECPPFFRFSVKMNFNYSTSITLVISYC